MNANVIVSSLAAILALALAAPQDPSAVGRPPDEEGPGMVSSVPEGTDEVLFNPGMGLAFCHWARPPPGAATAATPGWTQSPTTSTYA